MLRFLFALTLVCLLPIAARAQEELSRQAAVVAPFVNESTALVARLDLGVDVAQAAAIFGKPWVTAEQATEAGQRFKELREPFAALGVKEAYLLSAPLDLWSAAAPMQAFFVVVPVADQTKADAVQRLLHGLAGNVAEVRGNVVVAGSQVVLDRLKQAPAAVRPEFAAAWQATGGGQLQIAVLPPPGFTKIAGETLTEPDPKLGFAPGPAIARGLKWIALGLELPPKALAGRFVIQSSDEQGAQQLEKLFARGLEEAEASDGFALQFPSFLGRAKVALPTRTGSQLVTQVDEQHVEPEAFLELFQTPTALVREKNYRVKSINNLKHLALAMHTYHDAHKSLPPRASLSKDGKPLLSWRVAILPYLDQQKLYDEFHHDEPWDSEHNKKLIAKIPDVFKPATDQKIEAGKTCYLVPVGPGTIFEKATSADFADIKDGTSNTFMVIEAAPERAVEWTRPEDWTFDPSNPYEGLIGSRQDSFAAALADGGVYGAISRKESSANMRRRFQMADGEPIEDQ